MVCVLLAHRKPDKDYYSHHHLHLQRMGSNQPCVLCNQCIDIQAALNKRLIGIADARLYNIRYGLDRPVYLGLYKALRFYRKAVKDICDNNNCDLCYGPNLENVLERARTLSA